MKFLKNIYLYFKNYHIHDFENVSGWHPVCRQDEFDNGTDILAVGKCKICGLKELRTCYGSFQYYSYKRISYKKMLEIMESIK